MKLGNTFQCNTPNQPKIVSKVPFQNSKWQSFEIADVNFPNMRLVLKRF